MDKSMEQEQMIKEFKAKVDEFEKQVEAFCEKLKKGIDGDDD